MIRVLAVGFTQAPYALRIIELLTRQYSGIDLRWLVPSNRVTEAHRWLEGVEMKQESQVTLIEAKSNAIDFGLSGPEYLDLAQWAEEVHLMSPNGSDLGLLPETPQDALAVAREVTEFCGVAESLHLVHWSSTLVTADQAPWPPQEFFPTLAHEFASRIEWLTQHVTHRRTVIRLPYLIFGHRAEEKLLSDLRSYFVDRRDHYPKEAQLQVLPADVIAQAGSNLLELRAGRDTHSSYTLLHPDAWSLQRIRDRLEQRGKLQSLESSLGSELFHRVFSPKRNLVDLMLTELSPTPSPVQNGFEWSFDYATWLETILSR